MIEFVASFKQERPGNDYRMKQETVLMIPSVLATRFRDSLIEYMDASYPITTPVFSGSMKELFMDIVETMTMSYNYKPVFLLAFLKNLDETGSARLADVTADFCAFYEDRKRRGCRRKRRGVSEAAG